MLNHVQQIGAAALTLAFGLLALAVARRLRARPGDRPVAAWRVTAACFLVVGGVSLPHMLAAAAMDGVDRGSPAYASYMAWSAASNFGRTLAVLVYGAMLLGVVTLGRRWVARIAAQSLAALAGTAAVGIVVARTTSRLQGHESFSLLALLMAATVVPLGVCLVITVMNDGMDQLLWFAVAAYALKEALSVSLMATLVWWESGYSPAILQAYRIFYWLTVVVMAVMCVLARRRLALAAAGRPVPALFERLNALRRPVIG